MNLGFGELLLIFIVIHLIFGFIVQILQAVFAFVFGIFHILV